MKYKDIVNNKYGKLIVLCYYKNDKYNNALWLCKCDCGNELIVNGYALRSGHTQSCGCLQKEKAKKNKFIHGFAKTKLYKRWFQIKERCENPNNPSYKHYGGRNIKLCEEWHDFLIFQKWALNNGYQEKLTIERINVNGNYEPSNCIFATRLTQNRNTTRTYNINGYTAAEIARIFNLSRSTVAKWLRQGIVKTYEDIYHKAKLLNKI